MKTVSDCAVCLLKLAHTSATAAAAPEPLRMKAVTAALGVLARDDFRRIPPAIARDVLAAVYRALGTDDPFRDLKLEHDRKAAAIAREWAPGFLAGAADDDERLARAVRVALAGNALDLATLPEEADPDNFVKWIAAPWAVYDWADFQDRLGRAERVLYLGDNAGEIAFDRVLLEELIARGKRVTLSVKGGPALNDATVEDLAAAGLEDEAGLAVITTGDAAMGVEPERASEEWRRAFAESDMVIAKGQANLECLHNYGREVFFLTLIKCTHVARHYGLAKGAAMLYRGGRDREAD